MTEFPQLGGVNIEIIPISVLIPYCSVVHCLIQLLKVDVKLMECASLVQTITSTKMNGLPDQPCSRSVTVEKKLQFFACSCS
jgi:hypothetical protein